jgi:hypothetical protein
MGLHDPFGHLKHKLWLKERSKVKLVIWIMTTKSQESPQFPCVQVKCNILLESLNEGYNFALDFISMRGLHTKLWAPKVVGVLVVGISGLTLGSLEPKWHLGAGLVARHKVYYKGEGGGFPKSGLWWVLWVWVCPWLILTPKMLQLCTNQLVV